MALLSNINDKFAVDSTGAIQFNGQVGTSGYVLKSNANAAPTWVDPSTVIGGPYLPLTGGTLTGNLVISGSNSLTVGGVLTGTSATFSGNVSITKANTPELILTDTTNNVNLLIAVDDANTFLRSSSGAPILFQTNAGTTALTLDASQNATFSSDVFSDGLYVNSTTAVSGTQVAIVQDGAQNLQRWGTANSGQASYRFRIDQDMKFIANSGSGDNLIIYSDTGNIEGTTATFSGLVSGITPTAAANFATKAYVDAHPGSGGTVTGTGAANRVTYWSSATNVTSDAGFTYNGAGRVNTDESFGVSKDGADTVADGPFFRLTNAAATRQYIWQLDASNNIDYWYYNGTAWTQTISLLNNGGATFAGNVTAGYGFFNAESLTENLRVGGIHANLGLYIPNTYDMQFDLGNATSAWKFSLTNVQKFGISSGGYITVNEGGSFGGDIKTTGAAIGTTQADGDYLAKLYTASADGFLSLYTGQATPIEQVRISSYGPSYIVTGTLGGFGLGSSVTTGGFNVNWTFAGSYYNMSNTDSGNFKYTNQNGRLLTSNGTGWVADGRDPILTLSSAGNGGATTVGYSIGLNLYSNTSTDNTYSPLICFSNQSNSGNYATTYAAIGGKKTGQGIDSNWSTGELHFWTAGPAGAGSAAYMQQASAMMIDDAGAVGIATNTPRTKLEVVGETLFNSLSFKSNRINSGYEDAANDSDIWINYEGYLNGNSYNRDFRVGNGRNGQIMMCDGGTNRVFIGTGSTPSYPLDVTGTIRATGDVIAYSDARVKDNVKTIDYALEKTTKLRGVSYTRNDIEDKSTKIGVIAQEVLEVLPEVVSKDDEGKYSVSYGNIVGVLIEAIKELEARVKELENK